MVIRCIGVHGGQITDFCATEIINEVNNITEELRIGSLALDDALELEPSLG